MTIETFKSPNPRNRNGISVIKSKFLSVSSMDTLLAILKLTDARRDVILAGGPYHRFPWRHLPPPPVALVFDVFETGVELDAVDDFFSVAKGLVSDPSGVENVINIVLDAVFAAVVVGVSVVLYNVDDDVADSDDVDAVVATVQSTLSKTDTFGTGTKCPS